MTRHRPRMARRAGGWAAAVRAGARGLVAVALAGPPLGCSARGEQPAPPAAPGSPAGGAVVDAGAQLAALEARLLAAAELDVRAELVAEGAFTAKLRSSLALRGDTAALRARGRFGDELVEAAVMVDGREQLALTNRGPRTDPAPPDARGALVIGLVRMGVLHNVARIVGGQGFDHAEGGAAQWVVATDVAVGPERTIEGRAARSLAFGIAVNGQPSGRATLWLHPDTGLPWLREQVVAFPGGEMRVTERYIGVHTRAAGGSARPAGATDAAEHARESSEEPPREPAP